MYLVRLQGPPPTGKSFAMAEIAIFRMEGSKISIGLACTASSASTCSKLFIKRLVAGGVCSRRYLETRF
jgi:hypothetical protein